MNCTDCIAKLNDYVDGELTTDEMHRVDAHLATCANCRRARESLGALVAGAAALSREIAPGRDLWRGIARELEQPARAEGRRSGRLISWLAPLATAAAIAVLCTLAERGSTLPGRSSGWAVAALAGSPQVGSREFGGEGRLRVGEWLVTDSTSRAEVNVGDIGRVIVDPNSRLRLATAERNQHRLELRRGSLSASISAPPRIFFVETPSATAIDLGCAYTLNVSDNGDAELRVSAGYVALEHGRRSAIIPSGAMCLTRSAVGPGTPFVENASPRLRAALTRFDFGPATERASALATILAEAGEEDAITLWHLLSRAEGKQREDVFERLAKHRAPPEGVTRAGILAGDAAMRGRWGFALGLSTFGIF